MTDIRPPWTRERPPGALSLLATLAIVAAVLAFAVTLAIAL